ncbi:hypothetical protein D7X94_10985 [Acutalibacter sp. 1XD8-33]|nr:hypothetical protein D7X94_10985 [Acutalibacter sp. 1XD8-33]
MSGTGGGKFSPGTPITRAMLATVLHRMDNSPAPSSSHGFSDVPQGAYYEQAVAWALRNGIKGTAARPGSQHGLCGRFAKEHRRISRLQHDRRGSYETHTPGCASNTQQIRFSGRGLRSS